MPEKVQFRNGSKTEYWYDASGVKHQARWGYSTVNVNIPLGERSQENNNLNGLVTTYYVGNYVYEQGKLKRILTPEGYIETSPTGHMNTMGVWRYNYLLKDHLGNTRQRLRGGTLDENSTVLNTTSATIDYYPFGLEITPEWSSLPGTSTPYLYNGKEIDRMHGANWYDYGARMYDPVLGRWHTVDPLAEKYYHISSYVYVANNPVRYIDPDGRVIVDSNNNVIFKNGKWRGNGSVGARRIGEAMMLTPVGKELFNQLVESETRVLLVLDPGVGDGKKNGEAIINHTNNTATITIFEGMAIKKLAELQNAKSQIDQGGTVDDATSSSDKERLKNMPVSVEEIIGQKAVHESVHVLDKGSQRKYQPDEEKSEELPVKREIEAVKQTPEYRL